jgi:sulfur-carrier protein
MANVKFVYFAWVREKIGRASETVEVPANIATVNEVIEWLAKRGPEYASAFAKPNLIRTAINQAHVRPDAPLKGAREIAFFPPVTGG